MVADGSASSLMAPVPTATPQAALRTVTLASATDFAGFRRACRELWAAQVTPDRVTWHCADDPELDLFDAGSQVSSVAAAVGGAVPPVSAPAAFLALSESAVLHRDPARFALLYRLLWRFQLEPGLRAEELLEQEPEREEGDDDDELARNEGARQRPPARSRGECGEGDRRSAHVRKTAGASPP